MRSRASTRNRGHEKSEFISFALKLLVFFGILGTFAKTSAIYDAPPNFEVQCQHYLDTYRPPVKMNQVMAFIQGRESEKAEGKALFLMKNKIIYYDADAPEDGFFPRIIEVPFGDIERVKVNKFGFFGAKIYIASRSIDTQGSLTIQIPNKRYAEFFINRFNELRGERGPA